jgi:hypothetical protein
VDKAALKDGHTWKTATGKNTRTTFGGGGGSIFKEDPVAKSAERLVHPAEDSAESRARRMEGFAPVGFSVDGVNSGSKGQQMRLVHLARLPVGVEVVLAHSGVAPVHKAINGQPVVLRSKEPLLSAPHPPATRRSK